MFTWLKRCTFGKCFSWCMLPFIMMAGCMSAHAGYSCRDAGECRIPVQFKGRYMEGTCIVSINNASASETVFLPTLSTRLLSHEGDEAGSSPFKISLKQCPANQKVLLTFLARSNSVDQETGNLTNDVLDDYSRHVQIRLRKENNQIIQIGNSHSAQEYIIPLNGEEVEHYFIASYYARGTNTVTAGMVKAMANIDLTYN
jgi:major type 1 subunit fimbrin (pilin)